MNQSEIVVDDLEASVRRPIYQEGLDQWRRFEPWLEPLKSALVPLARSPHEA